MPKAPYTLEQLIAGYRAKIDRANRRAELLTIPASHLKMLLDSVEERLAALQPMSLSEMDRALADERADRDNR